MDKQEKRALKARKSSGIVGAKPHQLYGVILAFLTGVVILMLVMAWSLVGKGEQRQNANTRTLTIVDSERIKNQNPHLDRPYIPASTDGLPTYTREMARLAIRRVPWACGDDREVVDPLTGVRPMFSFVHVYKAAGSTLRGFFERYSLICRKSWIVLISCTKVKSSSIRANEDWKRCRVKKVVNGRRVNLHNIGDAKAERPYPTVNNSILRENIDIYGGHIQIGSGDFIHGDPAISPPAQTPPVRHIVFLRDPMARFVSGILYIWKLKEAETDVALEGIVKLIKKRVRGSRKANAYMNRSTQYLLTPIQSENIANITARNIELTPEENRARAQAVAAIENLVKYNVIIGMVEEMDQSMIILRHALLSDRFTDDDRRGYVGHLFENYDSEKTMEEEDEENDRMIRRPKEKINLSERDGVSTALVLQELKKDADFLPIFHEYVKFEQMINDFSWEMHKMQFEEATQKALSKQ
jgi:hypothetical protein